MKKLLIILITILGLFFLNNTFALDIQDGMLIKGPNASEVIANDNIKGKSVIKDILIYVKNTLGTLIMIFAIGAFMFVGFKLIVARGNAEEFKKAIQLFIYTIVGIAISGMAYAIVSIIASLKL